MLAHVVRSRRVAHGSEAQALSEAAIVHGLLVLLTPDEWISRYPARVVW
jgi:hypothetical protein